MKIPSFLTLSQGISTSTLRRLMNFWPPFLASSIHVERISEDFREIDVTMRLRPWSRNYVGTQFGGTMFAMCDPFWMIGTLRGLGEKEYIVWDKAGAIEFLAPGTGDVHTSIRITDEHLDAIRSATADGDKHLVWCENDIVADDGTVVARHRKQLYIRQKSATRKVSGRSRKSIAR